MVFGVGNPKARVVFVGEGPGAEEDARGEPFVGQAGRLLDNMLAAIGLQRGRDTYIANVVKCRPPGNRDPEPDEIAACAPYLRRQLEALDPAVVVTLGRFSLGTFMPGARIGTAHGTSRPVDPSRGAAAAQAFAMYHPAAAFRQAQLRETLFTDMAALPELLLRSRESRAASGVANASAPDAGAAASLGAEAGAADPQALEEGLLEAALAVRAPELADGQAGDPDQMRLF